MTRTLYSMFISLMLLASVGVAQQAVEQPAPPARTADQPGPTAEPAPGGQGMGQMQDMGLKQNMDKMATTTTRMAEVCEQMIGKEMAAMPYEIAAGITFGILVTLLLLIVLEVQWISYWSRLLKDQKRTAAK